MTDTSRIVFERGDYDIRKATFGQSEGFEVYRHKTTHSVRVASIGFPGAKGMARAMAEIDNRIRQEETL